MLPSEVLTMGTALRYAKGAGGEVEVHVAGGAVFTGTIQEQDGHGIVLVDLSSGVVNFVKLDAIVGVQVPIPREDLPQLQEAAIAL